MSGQMRPHLLLRLEAPLMAWGDVALDRQRKTRDFPSRSALAGLIASALGWTYADGEKTTALQDSLRLAVREDRRPSRLMDYQTADLGRDQEIWTRGGRVGHNGSGKNKCHIVRKEYLVDGSLLVALSLAPDAPATLSEIAEALKWPARPLFFGRAGCFPATPIMEGRVLAENPYHALKAWPGPKTGSVRCWYEPGDGPADGLMQTLHDRRDFGANRFTGSRTIMIGSVHLTSPEDTP